MTERDPKTGIKGPKNNTAKRPGLFTRAHAKASDMASIAKATLSTLFSRGSGTTAKDGKRVQEKLAAGHKNTSANSHPPFNNSAVTQDQAKPQEQTPSNGKSNIALAIAKPAILTGLTLGLTVGAMALYFAFVEMAPRVPDTTDLWNINRQSSIVMLDREGEELMGRGARYGEAVSVEELPPYLVAAFLATEDRRFYDHFGVDIRGTLRAAFTNYRRGRVVEGGSTITQQLAKNLFLKPDRTYKRKLREALLAIWLEGRYSKNELLSLYMNRIYLGAGAYGVEAAARTYFDKSARDVTLAEAAMLAGLPKAPSSLAPTQNLAGAENRSDEVVDNLLDIKAITPFEAREAKLNPARLAVNEVSPELGYVFDYISSEAYRLIGSHEGDLIITTTLDPKMQKDAETSLRIAMTIDTRLAGAEQAALISYDISGETRAMVGGRDYRDSQFNRAVQAKRQPGSAFKPFVYLAALEAGMTPETKFVDKPVNIDGWEPRNYSEAFAGPVRLTQAIAKSLNTVSVQVSEQIGREKVIEVAERLGITSPLNPHPSIALGATDLTLVELTGAYLPMARGGTKITPYIIKEIRDQNNSILYTHEKKKPVRVFTNKISHDLNHLLYQVMLTGTGRRASLGTRQTMGKTGTTNDWRDAWFVGYSAQIVTGVWVGNDAYNGMKKITGGSLPAEIWKTYMLAAHQGLTEEKLAGAYPATIISNEPVLLDFYADLSRSFSNISRERSISRRSNRGSSRRDNNTNRRRDETNQPRERRRGFFRRRNQN